MNFNCLLRGKVWSGSTLFLDARIQFEDTKKQSETRGALCPTTNEERQNAIELTLRKLRMQQSLLESHHVLNSPSATRVRGWYKYTISNLLFPRNPRNVSTFNSLHKFSFMDRTSTSTFLWLVLSQVPAAAGTSSMPKRPGGKEDAAVVAATETNQEDPFRASVSKNVRLVHRVNPIPRVNPQVRKS